MESIFNSYNYYKVQEGTELFDFMELSVNGVTIEDTYRLNLLPKLEEKLGIISTCLDMDLYKARNSYYFVLYLRKNESEEEMHPELEEITLNEFANSIGTDFRHYGFVGTNNFYKSFFNKLN